MLKQRIITALVLLPLAITLLFYPPLKWFAAILVPIFAIMAWEWSRLLETNKLLSSIFIALLVAALGFLFYQLETKGFFIAPYIPQNWHDVFPFKWLLVGLMVWGLAAVLVLLYPKYSKIWVKGPWLRMAMGLVILPVAWLAVVLVRSTQIIENFYYGGWLLLLMFIIIWGADVGAYFAGKNFGKTKLAPVVSPNKTWEGATGGLIFAVVAATGIGAYFGLPIAIKYFIPVAVVLVFISILGDLFESMLKRQAGIKDSSNILPGHGGLLDRLDSTLSVAPFYMVAIFWLTGGLDKVV